jgi:hypothetical protein
MMNTVIEQYRTSSSPFPDGLLMVCQLFDCTSLISFAVDASQTIGRSEWDSHALVIPPLTQNDSNPNDGLKSMVCNDGLQR